MNLRLSGQKIVRAINSSVNQMMQIASSGAKMDHRNEAWSVEEAEKEVYFH